MNDSFKLNEEISIYSMKPGQSCKYYSYIFNFAEVDDNVRKSLSDKFNSEWLVDNKYYQSSLKKADWVIYVMYGNRITAFILAQKMSTEGDFYISLTCSRKAISNRKMADKMEEYGLTEYKTKSSLGLIDTSFGMNVRYILFAYLSTQGYKRSFNHAGNESLLKYYQRWGYFIAKDDAVDPAHTKAIEEKKTDEYFDSLERSELGYSMVAPDLNKSCEIIYDYLKDKESKIKFDLVKYNDLYLS